MTNNNIAADPNWWPHRYDPQKGHVHYVKATREDHRNATFLTDEYLKEANKPKAVSLNSAIGAGEVTPIHFIFHSAYCCSTLLARAFDLPGLSMGLKEPQILNDLSGWRLRGAKPEQLAPIMSDVLKVLSRPLKQGEKNIIKPSNVTNGLAGLMLHVRPDAKAVFLYAPLRDFLGSIARKGMWGRLWVRELLTKQLREGLVNIGLQGEDYLKLTDLQVAAVGWIAQHQLFDQIVKQFGTDRVRTLNSRKLMADQTLAMQNLVDHFEVPLKQNDLKDLVSGPVFQRHSKSDTEFDASAREAERIEGDKQHAEEIEKVIGWAEAVAKNVSLPMNLSASLV
ncbi:MAG: hypothetical protein AB3N28_00520 [Kordiimonas sp.]